MDGGAPGGQEREITKANTARMIEKRLVAMGMVPLVNIQGQKTANNATKIGGIGAS
jgi:Fe2+ transport system protein FeoA